MITLARCFDCCVEVKRNDHEPVTVYGLTELKEKVKEFMYIEELDAHVENFIRDFESGNYIEEVRI